MPVFVTPVNNQAAAAAVAAAAECKEEGCGSRLCKHTAPGQLKASHIRLLALRLAPWLDK
jgi:hypothetical protein